MKTWALVLALVVAMPALADTVPEPDSYRLTEIRSPVPETVLGKPALSTADVQAVWQAGDAILIDVFPRPPKPAGLPEDTLWLDPLRESIEGGIWLPNTGFGRLTPEADAAFRAALATLTDGDIDRRLVFYCQAECWMSWNAARRVALEYGYTNVDWYPDGTDGWEAAGHATETLDGWSAPQ